MNEIIITIKWGSIS